MEKASPVLSSLIFCWTMEGTARCKYTLIEYDLRLDMNA